jgi:hypothetical protein
VDLDVASHHLWDASPLHHELLTGLQQLTTRLATGAAPVAATLTWKEVAGAAKSHTLTATQGVSLCSPVFVPALQDLTTLLAKDSDSDSDDEPALSPTATTATLRLPAFPAELVQLYELAAVGGCSGLYTAQSTAARVLSAAATDDGGAAVASVAPLVMAQRAGAAEVRAMCADA